MIRSKVGKALTKARPKTHGLFAEGAAVTQGIMNILQNTSRWIGLSDVKKEAIHMIIHKIHRITTGDANHAEHWDDIGGYAQLGSNDCVDAPKPKKRRPKKDKVKKAKSAVKKAVRVPPPPPVPAKRVRKAKKRVRSTGIDGDAQTTTAGA